MKRLRLAIILLVTVLSICLYILSHKVERITFDADLLSTFPSCKLWKEKYGNTTSFSEAEVDESQMLGAACFEERTEYLKLNKNNAIGVKFETEYIW